MVLRAADPIFGGCATSSPRSRSFSRPTPAPRQRARPDAAAPHRRGGGPLPAHPLWRSWASASFGFRVVPGGNARVRVQISAVIEEEHIDRALAASDKVGKEWGLL